MFQDKKADQRREQFAEREADQAVDVNTEENQIGGDHTNLQRELAESRLGIFANRTDDLARGLNNRISNFGTEVGGEGLIGREIRDFGDGVADTVADVADTAREVEAGIEIAEQVVSTGIDLAEAAIVDTTIEAVNYVDEKVDQATDFAAEVGREMGRTAVSIKDSAVETVQDVASFIQSAPSRLTGWFSSKIKGIGNNIHDRMSKEAKRLGGDGLIGQLGEGLADSVQSGVNGIGDTIDQLDEAVAYAYNELNPVALAKKEVQLLTKAYEATSKSLVSSYTKLDSYLTSTSDQFLTDISDQITSDTERLAQLARSAGNILAKDGILAKPFHEIASSFEEYGSAASEGLISFRDLNNERSEDNLLAAQDFLKRNQKVTDRIKKFV